VIYKHINAWVVNQPAAVSHADGHIFSALFKIYIFDSRRIIPDSSPKGDQRHIFRVRTALKTEESTQDRIMLYLFVGLAALSGLLALIMLFYRAQYRCYPGFGYWTAGMGLIAFSNILNTLRGVIPDAIPIVIGNTLFTIGILWFYQGMRKFLNMPDMSYGWYVLPTLNFAGCAIFYYIVDDPAQRYLWYAIAVASPLLFTAGLVIKRMAVEKFIFYPVIAVEMTLAGALILARAVWFMIIPDFSFFMDSPFQFFFFISMLALQVIIIISFIMLNSERLHRELLAAKEDLKVKIGEIEQYMSEVKVLSGLLPICASCKKIRDENDNWTQIEQYIRARSEAEFSHGICPECARKLYPEHWDKI
jgi:hypothetical protein